MDQELAAKLAQSCSPQASRWVENQKSRAKELLCHPRNDEIPKWRRRSGTLQGNMTDPPPCAGQDCKCRNGQEDLRLRCTDPVRSPSLSLIAFVLTGNDVDYTTMITMIDDMVALLKEEQSDDDLKESLDKTEDEAKGLAREITGQSHAVHDRTPCWH